MATTKKTETTVEIPAQFTESANAYAERMLSAHERLANAMATARARNARVADKFFEALVAGQRDALELSRAMIAEPTAYAKNMEAVVHSMTTAQERALEVAKTVYREQSEATGEMREAAGKAFESAKTWMPSFDKMKDLWSPVAAK
ncbi:MAG: hypothetical protein H6977_02315 [Gammaproteobacteria bacterium]|nr:hypothetical protein [Gammaproteobacteria bacterium]MCP5198818.1 hypothetical protein [Gammaproteobacteria bacterium]